MILAVIPLKQLLYGKRRLSGVLPEAHRVQLISTMAEHVIRVLSGIREIAGVSVLTGNEGLTLGNCEKIDDEGASLNDAVAYAGRFVESRGANSMLVVSADLPFLCHEDIRCMIAAGRDCGAVLATDSRGTGTNAILISPPSLFQPSFGEHSLDAHLATAERMGVRTCVLNRDGLAHDIDEPTDLSHLIGRGGTGYRFLHQYMNRPTE